MNAATGQRQGVGRAIWRRATRSTKRWLFLIHRWVGIALCVLLAIWFVSGIVMMYVGYPQLTPAERLAHLPVLRAGDCCVPLSAARGVLPDSFRGSNVTLSTIAGEPVYTFSGQGGFIGVKAVSGRRITGISRDDALRSAAGFGPGTTSVYRGLVEEDIWTRGHRLDPHRPLHRVQLNDEGRRLLYISSSTGEVVRDASRTERWLNFAGAWLHWLHAFRAAEVTWRGVVIGLSIFGGVLAITGTIAGVLQWKFRGRFRSGARTPYREAWLKWHHISGMIFALITVLWLFSGFMSMNPFGWLDSDAPPLDRSAYADGRRGAARIDIEAREVLDYLPLDFAVRELEWRRLGGRSYVVARDAEGSSRMLFKAPNGIEAGQLEEGAVVSAAEDLLPGARIADVERLEDYDFYYYRRASHTLFGHLERPLPVLRVTYDDPDATRIYIDPATGRILARVGRSERRGRMLFRLLHSWDFPPLLSVRPLWDVLMLLLLGGGLALSATGTVIGVRRLKGNMARRRR